MRGSINYQVNQVFTQSGIFRPGESKHVAKAEARAEGAKSWSNLGQALNIYSYQTAQTYKDTWHQTAHYAKSELGVRDVERLSSSDIRSFLESRIADGVKYATFQKEAAALSKLENAMNQYAERTGSGATYDFRGAIQEIRTEAADVLDRSTETRAYADPDKLINSLDREKSVLIAKIQHEGGARLYEASLIHKDQLEGIGRDSATGKKVGQIRLDGSDTKGGKGRMLSVSPATYRQLENHIIQHEQLRVDATGYRADLKQAAVATGQQYTGSHGLRWNFAQERFAELQQHGYSRDQALSQTSWDMGHERPDITEHYLAK